MAGPFVLPAARFDLASFGELVSDPSRVAMLLSLMDGSARPATELAQAAGVSSATASFHLRRLAQGGLVSVEPSGRHRYFRLANERVAEALETLATLHAPRKLTEPAAKTSELAQARTCYKHLAGRLGVAWLGALEKQRLLRLEDGALVLTPRGVAWCASAGLEGPRFPAGKTCLDWTERRHHLGGALGTLLTEHLFASRWIKRRPGGRAVRVTPLGARELARLGITAEATGVR